MMPQRGAAVDPCMHAHRDAVQVELDAVAGSNEADLRRQQGERRVCQRATGRVHAPAALLPLPPCCGRRRRARLQPAPTHLRVEQRLRRLPTLLANHSGHGTGVGARQCGVCRAARAALGARQHDLGQLINAWDGIQVEQRHQDDPDGQAELRGAGGHACQGESDSARASGGGTVGLCKRWGPRCPAASPIRLQRLQMAGGEQGWRSLDLREPAPEVPPERASALP